MKDKHLDEQTLASLVEGGHSQVDKESLNHLATCGRCHAAYAGTVRTLHEWHGDPEAFPADEDLMALGRAIPRDKGRGSDEARRRFAGVSRFSMGFGSLVLATSLMGILMLPPRPVTPEMEIRGEESASFTRPVEGEILSGNLRVLSWEPVPAATDYEIQVRDATGQTIWKGQCTESTLPLSPPLKLEPGGEYRALLSSRPADLIPPGKVSVAFARGSVWTRARHQWRWADRRAQAFAVVGLALLAFSILQRRSLL